MNGVWIILGVLITCRLMPDLMKHRLYIGLNRFQMSGNALLFMVTLSWISLGLAKPVISIAFCVAAFFVARGSSATPRMPQTIIILSANIAALILATMVAPSEIIQGLVAGLWGLIFFLVAKVISNLVNEAERSRNLRAAVLLFAAASILQVLPSPESFKSLFVIGGIFLIALAICWTNDHYVERPPFLELRDSEGKPPMFGTLRRRK